MKSKSTSVIGIDFGTTNTAVVRVTGIGEHGSKSLEVERFGENAGSPFSSIIAIPREGGKLVFGREVKERRLELAESHYIVPSLKSYIGSEREIISGRNRYSGEDVTCAFFKYLRKNIQKNYKVDIKEAALAFPVDFSAKARRSLKRAAERAGIRLIGVAGEATAAYISNRNNKEIYKAYRRIMVIDWGGGTLDISVLELKGTKVYESSIYGEKIGGDDIDLELAYRMHARLAATYGIDIEFDAMEAGNKDKLVSACEKAKIAFAFDEGDAVINLKKYGAFGDASVTLTYATFKDIVIPMIKSRALKAISAAMKQAQVSASGIDAVIMAGGSSGLKPFAHAVANVFGKEKIILPENTAWSVAAGVALLSLNSGQTAGKYMLNDDLGVVLSDGSVFPIFRKNVDSIGSKADPINFSIVEDTQNAHFVFANAENTIVYGKLNINVKGFLQENLQLAAKINEDQTVMIFVRNRYMGEEYGKRLELNKLTFYYDLEGLPGAEEIEEGAVYDEL
ncbi:MAG: Hsp70 family protein [Oscillospiraceae bacterium]|nr:Hsp70 family protein [Oscillospiraceae bacterium]